HYQTSKPAKLWDLSCGQSLLAQTSAPRQHPLVNLFHGQNSLVIGLGDHPCLPPAPGDPLYGKSSHPLGKYRVRSRSENLVLRFQPKQGTEPQHRRSRCPGLRQASRRILHRETRFRALVSSKNFRQTSLEEHASFEDPGNDQCSFFAVPVARKSGGNDATIVRPDSSVVIFDRVEPAFTLCHGSNAPSRKHLRAHEVASHCTDLVIIDDAAPKEVANVGAEAVHLPLMAIERDCEELPVWNPEVGIKPPL